MVIIKLVESIAKGNVMCLPILAYSI